MAVAERVELKLRLPRRLYDILRATSERDQISMNHTVRVALEQLFEKEGYEPGVVPTQVLGAGSSRVLTENSNDEVL